MENQKGISILTLIITIVIIIILALITMYASSGIIDDSINAKNEAQIAMDNDKIKEVITYELSGTEELLDTEINLKRIELTDTIKIEYSGEIYGEGYTLYLSEKDIEKVEDVTGNKYYYKSYKDISKSYIVKNNTEKYIRLEEEWEF